MKLRPFKDVSNSAFSRYQKNQKFEKFILKSREPIEKLTPEDPRQFYEEQMPGGFAHFLSRF